MSTGTRIGAGFTLALAIIMALGVSFYVSTQRLLEANRLVSHTHLVLEKLESVLSTLKDAETGQRGYVLTGKDSYLDPYNVANDQIRSNVASLKTLTRDNPDQQLSLAQLQTLIDAEMAELREIVDLRRNSGLDASLQVILSGHGKKTMEDLRGVINEMQAREQRLLDARNSAADTDARQTINTIAIWTPLSLLLLAGFAMLITRKLRFGGPIAPAGGLRSGGWRMGLLRYGFAVVAVAIGAALRLWLMRAFGPLPTFITLYPAVLLVASTAGGGPGIVASVLAALLADYLYIRPIGSLGVEAPNDMLALGIFTSSNLFLCVFAERLRRACWAEAVTAVQEEELAERKRAADELYRQREMLRVTLSSIGDAVIATDTAGRITFLNPVAESLTGWHSDAAMGQPVTNVFNIVNEKTHEPAENIADLVLREKRTFTLANHTALLTRDGQEIPIEDSAAPILDVVDNVVGAVLVFHDVTQKRRVQEELRSAALFPEQNPNPVLRSTGDGQLLYANAAAREMLEKMGWSQNQILPEPFAGSAASVAHKGIARELEFTCADNRTFSFMVASTLDHDYANFYGRDVTKRIRVEEDLRRQREWLRVTLTSIGDGVITCDTDGKVTFINPVAESLSGWSTAAAMGQPIENVFRIINEKTHESAEDIVERVLREKTIVELANHTALVKKDGGEVSIEDSAAPIVDITGSVVGVVLVFHDVTEKRLAREQLRQKERELQEREERLRLFIEHAPVALAMFDRQMGYISASHHWMSDYGLTSEDLAGRSHYDIFPEIPEHWKAVHRRALAGEVIRCDAERFERAAGSAQWLRWEVRPWYDADGHVAGIVIFSEDITESKLAQDEVQRLLTAVREEKDRLSSLLNSISDEVWFADTNGKFALANPSAAREFQLESPDGIDVEHLARSLEVYRGDGTSRPVEEAPPLRALAGEIIRDEEEIVRTPGSDELRHRQVSASPVRDANGDIIGSVSVVRDITERKRAMEAQRNSEQQYQDLFTTLIEGFCIIDMVFDSEGKPVDYRFLVVNPAFEKQTGLHDAQGKLMRELAPSQESYWFEIYGKVALTGKPTRFVNEAKALGRWYDVSAFRVGGPESRKVAILFNDITDAKRMEEQLRELSQRLTYHMDCSPLAVIEWGPDMRLTRWSGEAERIFGWNAEEVLGKRMEDFRWIYTEDESHVAEVSTELQDGSNPRRFSANRNYRKDGSVAYCEWYNSSLLDQSGKMRSILSLVLDVTDRKEAEEALERSRATLNEAQRIANIGSWEWDVQTGEVLWSDQMFILFGEDRSSFVPSYEGFLARLHPDDRQLTDEAIRDAIARGGHLSVEYRIPGNDQIRDVLAQAEVMIDQHGQPLRVVGTALDITSLKQAEQALRDADRHKDEFLAMLAHELRNPLTPVRNAIQVMNMIGPKDPVLQKNRQMVERQIGHMARLLDDLLDVSRISRGKISLQVERLDLRTTVAQAVEVAEHALKGRRLEIDYNPPSDPVWIEGDYTRLEQITGNLLSNAIKYTDEGRIGISLTTDRSPDGGRDWAVIQVSDTGIGIPAHTLPHVFDLFTQADQTLDRPRGGLGIGLTMVEHLVQMHGGTVQARSEGPGKGSQFSVRLPMAEQPAVSDDNYAGKPDQRPKHADRKLRALVVDDSEDAAASMSDILQLWGYEVKIAHDGSTALTRSLEDPPDVILLDIGLPGMSGYEVARRLRTEPSINHVKIFAITGYGQDEDRKLTAESGCDAHLVKPVDLRNLQAMLAGIESHANEN